MAKGKAPGNIPTAATVLISIGCASLFVILIILLGLSFAAVKPTEYGLLYSTWTQKLEQEAYGSGRPMVGPTSKFITFPRILTTFEFSSDFEADSPGLQVFSSDGQTITIELSFQARLDPSRLYDLYLRYEEDWQTSVVHFATQAIKDTSVKFLTLEFFTERITIRSDYLKAVNSSLAPIGITVEYLQLRDIIFDDAFEVILQNKVVTAQQRRTTANIQNSTLIEADTRVIIAQADQDISIINANATAEGTLIEAQARADGLKLLLANESDLYRGLRDSLSLSNDLLLEYIWSRYISTTKDTILVGVENIILS